MTSAKAAFGVTLSREGSAVAEIIEMGDINFERDFIDVTNHASPGGYEENIPSAIIRTGELTIVCNSILGDANGQEAIKDDWKNKTSAMYAITFPDGRAFSGEAIVKNYGYITKIDEQIKFTATLKWTGELDDNINESNNLSGLVITTAALYPAFAAATYDYVAVSTGDTCTVTATFAAGTAKLYKNGTYVQALASDAPSGEINLGADGTNTELEIVITETNKAPKTYKIKVANAAA